MDFNSRLAKLNPEQRKAVDQIDGPVMVVAGPGTGKTETLGARISNILHQQTDIHAGNILCLTYTTAGVVAMRKRLLEFIGPDAHKVEIHTFHSFCNSIIQENSEYFNILESENISELSQYEIMEELLHKLPASDLHFQKNSFLYAKNLLGIFNVFKSENWTEKTISDAIKEYLQEIPNDENFQYKRKYTDRKTGKVYMKGDANPKKIQVVEERCEKLRSASQLFTQYSHQLEKNGQYDFQDMILWILEAFRSDQAFLAEYQERFQYILVDEFQDTNGSQKELVDFLCSYWDEPNVFVVGDDDQSIYRFQGANMRNIMDFYSQYKKDITLITLDKNYRSSQNILDCSSKIIEKNEERLEKEIPNLNKKLTASHPRFSADENNIQPSLREYYNDMHEDLGIFKRIKALQKKGVKLSDIAVLYQNHSQAKNIIKLCETEKIPVRVKETQNILDLPIIHRVIDFLKYFQKESELPFSGEGILFPLLFSPFLKIDGKEIIHLAIERKKQMKEQETRDIFFKQLLSSDENILGNFGATLLQLEQDFHSLPLLPFLEKIFNRTGLLKWVLEQKDKGFLLRLLSTFFHFVKEKCSTKENFSVKDLLDILKRMEHHGLKIPIEKIQFEKEGVHFITTHSSKGLEFEYVFLKGVNKRVWDNAQRQNYFLPPTLTRANDGDFLEEKRRLFFVAITRAKKFIEISFAGNSLEGKELDDSLFISELEEQNIVREKVQYDENEIEQLQYIEMMNSEEKSEDNLEIDTSFLEILLENYSLSSTHLNKYLQCPKSFYFENLLQIPSSMPPAASFGNAVHFALEKTLIHAQQSDEKKYDETVLIENFQKALHKEKFLFTKQEFIKYQNHGKEVLHQYFEKFLKNTTINHQIFTEKFIKTGVKNIPIKGKLDKIEKFLKDGISSVSVVDYKTGNPDSKFTKEKLLPPSEKNNFLGGDYWRQMVFYAILLENNVRDPQVLHEGIFDFVEPQKGIFYPAHISIDNTAKEKVIEQIENVYAGIMAGNFEGCGEEECNWCGK